MLKRGTMSTRSSSARKVNSSGVSAGWSVFGKAILISDAPCRAFCGVRDQNQHRIEDGDDEWRQLSILRRVAL